MSTTMTMMMTLPALAKSATTTAAATPTTTYKMSTAALSMLPMPPCCPKCGYGLEPSLSLTGGDIGGDDHDHDADAQGAALAAAQRQIEDLQAQVRLLNQKAAAAVDRWADYEDELVRLRRQVTSGTGTGSNGRTRDSNSKGGPTSPQRQQQQQQQQPAASPMRGSFLGSSAATRISQLLSPRAAKSTPNLKALPPTPSTPTTPAVPAIPGAIASPPPSAVRPKTSGGPAPPAPGSPSTNDLLAALSREQDLRRAAEASLNDTSREVEELSATLFEQANEMVATERRARAKLEERVGELERRDMQKRARLERLEQAIGRIERVRALLDDGAGGGRARASAP